MDLIIMNFSKKLKNIQKLSLQTNTNTITANQNAKHHKLHDTPFSISQQQFSRFTLPFYSLSQDRHLSNKRHALKSMSVLAQCSTSSCPFCTVQIGCIQLGSRPSRHAPKYLYKKLNDQDVIT